MFRGGKALFSFLIFLIIISCSSSKSTIDFYIDPEIKNERRSLVAVFPIGKSALTSEETNRIHEEIYKELSQKFPKLTFYSPEQVVEDLKENELYADWENFWENYSWDGALDKSTLFILGTGLRINTIIKSEIYKIYQEDGDRRKEKGYTEVTLKFSMFSTTNGKLLWEANITGIRKSASSKHRAPELFNVVKIAVREFIKNVPLD